MATPKPIPIDGTHVLDLINKKFGSVDNFCVEWEFKVDSKGIGSSRAKNRATVYRWLKHGLPTQISAIFGFCGVLDVDPMSIIDFENGDILKNFGRIRMEMLKGEITSSRFKAFWEMFVPGPHWPSNSLSQRFYQRDWHTLDFKHDPSQISKVYALLEISIPTDIKEYQPIVFHIAYRRKSAADKAWRPYGSIIAKKEITKLISESGDFQIKPSHRNNDLVFAETFFGPGPAEFRLASLHEFTLEIQAPSTASDVVRFVA